jgi:8-oxo-dGTP pyrophosphatase MutT (NUDIX family)
MKTAVALLIFDKHGAKILAISRRDRPDQWGFPGGKVDPGESNVQAALRELREETGLNVYINEVTPLFTDICAGDVNYWCTTYLSEAQINPGSLLPEEGLNLTWMWPEELCNPKYSPFANYNSRVMRAYEHFKELS